ncbi:transcription factor GTE4-like [Phalaenopsis equestris]|uniref:transcription factor GTE4-like n=1 Tax=Phalaenopsis equestris TaxID=78828 RepID=UPI0009E6456B|nr:transcription factor GTE4-like [Phalaenopsis equestris]XP_020583627.1 transcription factor GTE4-like [Phalaenopsis equestris]
MESGPLLDGGEDDSREKRRWVVNKVYTRKAHNKTVKPNSNQTPAPVTPNQPPFSQQTLATTSDGIHSPLQQPKTPLQPLENPQPAVPHQLSAASDYDTSSLNPKPANHRLPDGQNRVITINLALKEKHEVRELRRNLISELELIRSLVRKIEARQMQLSMNDTGKTASPPGHTISQFSANDFGASFPIRKAPAKIASPLGHNVSQLSANVLGVFFPIKRAPAISETALAAAPTPVRHQLTVSVPATAGGDNDVVDVMEKEKRTPKANQFYKNTDFLLGKERLPPESNKKSRVSGTKNGRQSMENKINEQAFKKCSVLLSKLMKHNFGWVFNTPVDAEALGLSDYHKIITHPMDLSTIKSRLSKNWYKAPKEFAEDVRLTFHNAMTYNPKGQDVYIMAQQLLQIFEERWPIIEADIAYLRSPLSMKRLPPLEMKRTLERSDSTVSPLAADLKTKSLNQLTHIGRPPASKKPKAKDPNKREMTFEEKQRLSNNLQNLPSEKLDMVVQIIRKRNLSLSQHEDEIEVDIDSVDTETLWELDRFVTNYKKSLSKIKRKAELAMLSKAEPELHAQNREQLMVSNSAPSELLGENKTVTVENIIASSSPVRGTMVGKNASPTSSSSSSSSDSGSSSSDSDSESSSQRSSDGAQ